MRLYFLGDIIWLRNWLNNEKLGSRNTVTKRAKWWKTNTCIFVWSAGLFCTAQFYSLGVKSYRYVWDPLFFDCLFVCLFVCLFKQSTVSDMQHFPGHASEDQVHLSGTCVTLAVFLQLGDCSPPQLLTLIPNPPKPTIPSIAPTRS